MNKQNRLSTGMMMTLALILSTIAALMAGVSLALDFTRPEYTTPPAGGTSHFSNLEAADITATDDLFVTDDATITGTLTFDDDALTALGYDGSTQYEIYFGTTSTFTGSTTITATTHGLATAVDVAYCWPTTPDDDAGDPYLCDPSWSTTVLTLSVLQDDATAATVGDTVSYLVIGR
jgi:hypothetical protein